MRSSAAVVSENRRARRLAALAVLLGTLSAAPARAERCGPPVPWIDVRFGGDEAWLNAERARVLSDLRAEMHVRGIAVCGPDDPREGAANATARILAVGAVVRIDIGARPGDASRATADAGLDDAGDPRMAGPPEAVFSRELDLGELAVTVRPRQLANSVFEALRSNWERFQDTSNPLNEDGQRVAANEEAASALPRGVVEPPGGAVAATVGAGVMEAEMPAEMPVVALRTAPLVEAFSTGQVWIGGMLGALVRPIDRLELALSIDGGLAAPQTVALGVVDGRRLTGLLEAALTWMGWEEPFRVQALLGFEVGGIWLEGSSGDTNATASDWIAVGRFGVELVGVLVAGVELRGAAWAAVPFRGAHATDGTRALTGIAEAGAGGRLGLAWWL